MYYSCKSCHKVWYYPIEKCVFCHQPVDRIVPKRFTIRAITNVEVPSRENPKVPYAVLMLEDEQGNTHTMKTFRDFAVGDVLVDDAVKTMNRTVVAVKQKYDLEGAFERLMRISRGFDITETARIMIKISLKAGTAPHLGSITNPQLVKLVINHLYHHKVKLEQITLCDRLPAETDVKKILAKTDYASIAEKVSFVNLTEQAHETIPVLGQLFDIPRILLGTNLLINIPPLTLQTDRENAPALFSLAELIPGQVESSAEKVAKLPKNNTEVIPPTVTIIDASIGSIYTQQKYLRKGQFKMLYLSNEAKCLDRALADIYLTQAHDLITNASYELHGEELEVISHPLTR
ncbi:MAG TPA: hypothetical protein PKL83_02365 [bacterium]|nr:hypothetical protein [bacterium]